MSLIKKRDFILLAIIFIIAVSLRVSTSLLLPIHQGPDAPEYKLVAKNIADYFKGKPIEDKELFLNVAGRRGWLYPLFIALILFIFGQKYYLYLVAGFQILLDSFSCILIYLTGKRFFSERVARLAASLVVIYPGLIYYSKFISQEATITFLLVLFVYVITYIGDYPTWKNHLSVGILLGFITIYRPSYQFLFISFLPLFAYYLKRFHQSNWRVLFTCFVTGLGIIIIGWMTFSYKVNKQVILYKSGPWGLYETIRNDGWHSDDYFNVVDEDLYKKLSTMGYSPPPKGTVLDYDHNLPSSVYLKLILEWVKDHPLQTFSQMLKRIYRMWFYIETYPARWHSTSIGIQLFSHRLLIILSLVGISLSLSKWRSLWIVYLLIFYANFHILMVGVPRYGIPSMPFVLLLSSYALITIITKAKLIFSYLNWRDVLWISGFIISALIFYSPSPISVGVILALLPFLSPEAAYYIRIFMGNLNFLILSFVIYLYLRYGGAKKAFSKAMVFILLSLPLLNNTLITNKNWHEWWCDLKDRNFRVVQKIYLPPDLEILPSTRVDLFIDMFGGGGGNYTFVVKVNGRRVKSYDGGLKSDREKFRERFFDLYEYIFFYKYQLRPEDLRQWYRIPLDREVLKTKTPIEVECYVEGNPDNRENYVYIFGDYVIESLKRDNVFEGPSIPSTNQDTALYKIMPYEGDYRFETRLKLQSERKKSFFCKGDNCHSRDLSDSPGIQRGNYRIHIRLLDGEKQTLL